MSSPSVTGRELLPAPGGGGPGPLTLEPTGGRAPRHCVQPTRRPVALIIGQLGRGGSERQLRLFIQACDLRSWDPHVYAAGHLGRHADDLRASGLPVTLLTGHWLHKLWQFRRAVRAQRATAFVSWSSWSNVFVWALLGLRLPRLGSFRSAGFNDLPRRAHWLWSWASRARLSTVVCNSPETAAVVGRRLRASQRVLVVPNAVEPPSDPQGARERWRRDLGVGDDEVLVLGIGRLAPQKAFDLFVDAVATCHAEHPVKGVVIGPDYTGRAAAPLLAHMTATGLPEGTLRWWGPTEHAREAVCAADVFLLSSAEEGMPNVVLEAMAAGVPVVTTPVGGVSSLVGDGQAGLIAGHDATSLSEALLRLVRDPALRQELGAVGRRRLRDRCAPSIVYQPLWDRLAVDVDRCQRERQGRTARRTRVADVTLCLLSAPLTLPLAAVLALAVRASSPGPVLHHGVRVGRDGQLFRLHKFRSMSVGADVSGPGITRAGDPRTTPLGRWLRRTKLDELPQLVNVLAGEMSLVGPRPEDPRYVDVDDQRQRCALTVRPGLTSPASLRFSDEQALLVGDDWERTYRESVLPRKLALDAAYVQQATLLAYARVLVETLRTLISRDRTSAAHSLDEQE